MHLLIWRHSNITLYNKLTLQLFDEFYTLFFICTQLFSIKKLNYLLMNDYNWRINQNCLSERVRSFCILCETETCAFSQSHLVLNLNAIGCLNFELFLLLSVFAWIWTCITVMLMIVRNWIRGLDGLYVAPVWRHKDPKLY